MDSLPLSSALVIYVGVLTDRERKYQILEEVETAMLMVRFTNALFMTVCLVL